MKRLIITIMVAALFLAFLVAVEPALANAPTGDVVLATTYPSVVADKGKPLTFPIEIVNRGQDWQEITLQAQGPEAWQPGFKDKGFTVRKVMVAPGKSQTVEFQAQPPADARAGDYNFSLRAVDAQNQLVNELILNVALQDKVSAGLKLSTQYPDVRGQAGTTITYRLDLVNDASQDRDIALEAAVPQGWEATFKPAYESKQVTQLRVKAGATQGVDLELSPPQKTEASEYSVMVTASAGADRAQTPLKVTIVGSNKLSFTPANGLLSAKATVDQETSLNFIVKNTGTAPLKGITFSSSRPDGWQVTFNPERVEELPVGEQAEVSATLKPSNKALAGDYMVSMTASGPSTSESKDIRVTVETPTTWGWIAIAAVAAVVLGLGGLFARLSRR